jgi:CHAT domain-containing protein/tetratricopeptide (TPR) repeat protein
MTIGLLPGCRRGPTDTCAVTAPTAENATALAAGCLAQFEARGDVKAGLRALQAHALLKDKPAAESLRARLRQRPDGTSVEGDVLLTMAQLFAEVSDPRARPTWGQAAQRLAATGDHKRAAEAAMSQSRLAWKAIEHQEALAALDRAHTEAQAAGDRTLMTRALLGFVLVLYEIGDLPGARRALAEARQSAPADATGTKVLLTLNEGLLADAEGHTKAARAAFEKMLAMPGVEPKGDAAWTASMNLLTMALDTGDLAWAETAWRAAESIFNGGVYKSRPTSRIAWGVRTARLERLRGQAAASLTRLDALKTEPLTAESDWRIALEKGHSLRALKRFDEAAASFEHAITIVEGLRQDQFDNFKSWILAQRRAPYVALFELHLARGETAAALEVFERTQGRTFLDAFAASGTSAGVYADASAKIESLKKLYPMLRASPVVATLPLSGKRLANEIAQDHIIGFFEGNQHLYIVDIDRGRPAITRIGASLPEVQTMVTRFLENLGDAGLAETLGKTLFANRTLGSKRRSEKPNGVDAGSTNLVYVIPSVSLARLPFAALRRDGRYLGEDVAFAQIPSANALVALRERSRANNDRTRAAPVVLADATGDLPDARQEAHEVGAKIAQLSVAELAGQNADKPAQIFVGKPASADRLQAARGTSLLHLAVHSGVDAAGPWLAMSDRKVLPAELVGWGIGADLVVLASCASTATRDPGLWGSLVSAFLATGSPSVVGSLWSTKDQTSRAFVNAFYAAGGARDPIAALARTQRSWIAENRPTDDWAAFAFYGPGAGPPSERTTITGRIP